MTGINAKVISQSGVSGEKGSRELQFSFVIIGKLLTSKTFSVSSTQYGTGLGP